MRRRTLLGSGLAAASVCAFGVPALAVAPKPSLFQHESLRHARATCSGQFFGDWLRDEFLRRVDFVPVRRTAATQRRELRAMYTFEMAYDGIPPVPLEAVYAEMTGIVVSEIAAEFSAIQPVHLVALDTPGVRLDPATFQPYLGFYLDHNT